jgi:ubiquitin C-terminal hydrolase
MYEYDLFAVICHEGQLDNGHYIIFARYQDEVRDTYGRPFTHLLMLHIQWCRYDDDK